MDRMIDTDDMKYIPTSDTLTRPENSQDRNWQDMNAEEVIVEATKIAGVNEGYV
jgi:hypothetical protein